MPQVNHFNAYESPTDVDSVDLEWQRMVRHEPMLSPLRGEAQRLLNAHPNEYRFRYERLRHLLRPLVGHNAWNVDLQNSNDWNNAIRFLCREADV